MTRWTFNLVACTAAACFDAAASAQTTMTTTQPVARATNPVMWADVPDLSIIRVGDRYYMGSTTAHLSPGLPIMRSDDLANWRMVSYAHGVLEDHDAIALRNGRTAYGGGSWASSVRFHNGTYYATTFSGTTNRTYVYTTTDPDNGPWKATSFAPSLHDHTLHFDDDGRVYMIHAAGALRLTELNADLSGIKPGGVDQVIIEDASRVAGGEVGLRAEGSQLWKVNGRYYLFNITWPRGGMRTQIVHRAERLTGPWEGRVVLADRGIAQGGIIDTPDGRWFAYLFQDHGAVGRIPYLLPMTWEDGWPVVGVDGKAPAELDLPPIDSASGVGGIVASDEFDRQPGEPALPLAWQWNHTPEDRGWSLTDRPGQLRLTTTRVAADFPTAPNTLTQRTFGPTCSAVVALDATRLRDGDFAGLGALQKLYGFVGVRVDGDSRSLVMMATDDAGAPVEAERIALDQPTVFLKVECDFRPRPGRGFVDQARFFYSLDGERWTAIGRTLDMKYTLPHFMGYRFGLFNFATKAAGGSADFDYYRVEGTITAE